MIQDELTKLAEEEEDEEDEEIEAVKDDKQAGKGVEVWFSDESSSLRVVCSTGN